MTDYERILQRDKELTILSFNDNGVKIFHIPFPHPSDVIYILAGGPRCSKTEYERAAHGEADCTSFYHAHDCYFLVYVVKGTNYEIVEGSPILMNEQDLLMITPYTRHHNLYTAPSEVLFIHIQPEMLFQILLPAVMDNILFADFFSDFLADRHVRKSLFFQNCMKDVRPIMERILDEYMKKPPLYQAALQFLLGELIIGLARGQTMIARHFSDAERDKMNEILQYIALHYKDISLTQLSRHFGYQSAYLSRKIRDFTGKTYSQLITGYRLNRAAILLREKKETVEEISYACGYHDVSTFYKAFKKQFHCAPKEILTRQAES